MWCTRLNGSNCDIPDFNGVGRGEESEEITQVSDTIHVRWRPRRRAIAGSVASRYLTRSTCAGARVVGLLRVRWPAGWAPPSEHVVDALPVDDALRHGMTVRGTMMQRISQGMIGSGWRLAMSNFSCRRGMGVMFSNHGSSSHSHPIFYFPKTL
ncbi:hypothetical protein C4D60_Mb02t18430 [Musa balbisiana]|uniref:Uncharacterized protein n=1 Tax=Musa balbisiana TaxID=52838 RepID=A0A4S8IBN8_MUSBA|nr:hypothetical protein C4D60_Mb02t18430 [Musa balbisiana]